MRFLNRFTRYLYQLSLSYVVLVILVTTALGFAGFWLFRSAYTHEISERDEANLDYVVDALEATVFNQLVESSSAMIAGDLSDSIPFFLENPLEGNHERALDVHNQLVNASLTSSVVSRIDIYFDRGGFVLSSESGLVLPRIERHPELPALEWIDAVGVSPSVWALSLGTQHEPRTDADEILFIKRHPVSSNVRKAVILVAARVDSVVEVFREHNRVSSSSLSLLDPSGTTVAWHQGPNGPSLDSAASAIADGDATTNTPLLVSRRLLRPAGWEVVRITSTDRFLSEMQTTRRYLLLICAGAIVLGLAISHALSRAVYGPVHRIVGLAREHVGGALEGQEVEIVREAFSSLSMIAKNAQRVLQSNLPVFREHLVHRAIHGELADDTAFHESMALLGWEPFEKQSLVVGLMKLESSLMRNTDFAEAKAARYDLIGRLESLSSPDVRVAAAELVTHEIAVVFIGGDAILPDARRVIRRLLDYCTSRHLASIKITLGRAVHDSREAEDSYATARLTADYLFYLPRRDMLEHSEIQERDSAPESKSAASMIDEFEAALPGVDLDRTWLVLDRIRNELVIGGMSLAGCRRVTSEIVNLVADFATRTGAQGHTTREISKPDALGSLDDLDELIAVLKDSVREAYDTHGSNTSWSETQVLESVRSYVIDNITGDLSAATLAEHAGLSPSYLGSVLKRVSGKTIPEFVNRQRLEIAKTLLFSGNKTIKEIAFDAGYQSPTYFIRRFSKEYGMSPDRYRNLYQAEGS